MNIVTVKIIHVEYSMCIIQVGECFIHVYIYYIYLYKKIGRFLLVDVFGGPEKGLLVLG